MARPVPLCLVALLFRACLAQAQDVRPEEAEAHGGSRDEDARLHFELGRRAYARADYEAALTEFQQAYAYSSRPELHYNLFLVYHELERDEEGVVELRAYLETLDEGDSRAQLEERLARIEAAIAARRAGEAREEAAEDAAAPAETIAIGEQVVLPPTSEGGDALTVAGAATLGVGALSLVAFGLLGALALNERQALDGRCAPVCSAADVATGRDLAASADVTLGVGVALAAVGGVLLGLGLAQGAEASAASRTPAVSLAASPTGAAVTLTGSL